MTGISSHIIYVCGQNEAVTNIAEVVQILCLVPYLFETPKQKRGARDWFSHLALGHTNTGSHKTEHQRGIRQNLACLI